MFETLTLAFQSNETKQHHENDRPQLLRARGIALHRAKVNDQLLGAKLEAPYCVIQIVHDAHQLFATCGRNGDNAPLVPYRRFRQQFLGTSNLGLGEAGQTLQSFRL
jgi:hypothetical protein